MANVRARFWGESLLSGASAVTLVAALVWPEWLEAIFGIDPDGGSGALERGIGLALAVSTVAFAVLARLEWSRQYAPAG